MFAGAADGAGAGADGEEEAGGAAKLKATVLEDDDGARLKGLGGSVAFFSVSGTPNNGAFGARLIDGSVADGVMVRTGTAGGALLDVGAVTSFVLMTAADAVAVSPAAGSVTTTVGAEATGVEPLGPGVLEGEGLAEDFVAHPRLMCAHASSSALALSVRVIRAPRLLGKRLFLAGDCICSRRSSVAAIWTWMRAGDVAMGRS